MTYMKSRSMHTDSINLPLSKCLILHARQSQYLKHTLLRALTSDVTRFALLQEN